MSGNYILVEGIPVPEPDLLKWGKWFEDISNRRVALTNIGVVRVSTVFLGMDHNFSREGPPVLYETLVENGALDDRMERYCTREDALRGHFEIVRLVLAAEPGDDMPDDGIDYYEAV
jgi:hypothetical protein